jgi:hypothetical protein
MVEQSTTSESVVIAAAAASIIRRCSLGVGRAHSTAGRPRAAGSAAGGARAAAARARARARGYYMTGSYYGTCLTVPWRY